MLKVSGRYRVVALLLGFLFIVVIISSCSSSQPAPTPAPASAEPGASTPVTDGNERTYNFSIAHFFPETHTLETDVSRGWAKAVTEATNGRITFDTYPAETLLKAEETYQGIVDGVADVGLSAYAYTSGRFPVLETLLLPGVSFYNSEASSQAAMAAIEMLDPEELHDVHHLFSWGSGPADLFSKRPIRNLDELKGLRIGATAGSRADIIELLGATPVDLPMSKWYEALSIGVIDGGVAPLESLLGFRLGEATGDYITLTPFLYNQIFFCVMNLDAWNSLTPELQQIVTGVTGDFYPALMPGLWDNINAAGVGYIKTLKNVTVTVLSEEETARWMEPIPQIQNDYVEKLNGKGFDGAVILQTMKDLADKYNTLYPDVAPYINQ